MTKKLVLIIALVLAVPAEAENLAQLRPNVEYTFTFTRGANNNFSTAVIFFAVSGSGVTVLDTQFLLGTDLNPDFINLSLGKRVNALIIQVSPTRDGSANPGTFTITVTNTVTQATVVNTTQYTDDHQLVFQVIP